MNARFAIGPRRQGNAYFSESVGIDGQDIASLTTVDVTRGGGIQATILEGEDARQERDLGRFDAPQQALEAIAWWFDNVRIGQES